ncbi:hypothetical protein HMPREF1214_03732 [Bacteroides sp. HPS0048]|jgi:hypothetical protein|nr:hypothetical protein HMPREF1214_03732 [Bacteroides sp. HPS0048]
MLTLKQTPPALIGMFLTIGLADGDPEPGKLTVALLILVMTILYVLVCNEVNRRKNGAS